MSGGRRLRLLLHLESLWGVGHLVRGIRLLRELAASFDCTLLSGSPALALFDLPSSVRRRRLTSIRYSEDCAGLVSNASEELEAVLQDRREQARANFLEVEPDILMVEMFPFGRHAIREECLLLLELARQRGIPCVISLRDVCTDPVDPERRRAYESFVVAVLQSYAPLVLVHSDPTIQPLTDAVPPSALRLNEVRFVQTGFVGHEHVGSTLSDNARIRCTVGGGRQAPALLQKSIELIRTIRARPRPAVILGATSAAGLALSLADYLREECDVWNFDGSRAFGPFDDVAGWITTGGYNSWMDIMATRVPTVVVALDDEQRLRTKRLLPLHPWVRSVDLHEPTHRWRSAWEEATATTARAEVRIDTRGAGRAVREISALVKQ